MRLERKRLENFRSITIVLETPEDIDLFWHIVNNTVDFQDYIATLTDVIEFRHKTWSKLQALNIEPRYKKDVV